MRNTLKNKLQDTENRFISLSKANTHNLVLLQRRNFALEKIREFCQKCEKCIETGDEVILHTIKKKINEVLND